MPARANYTATSNAAGAKDGSWNVAGKQSTCKAAQWTAAAANLRALREAAPSTNVPTHNVFSELDGT